MPLERAAVLALAPLALANYRSFRYRGDDQAIPHAAFADEDQASLGALYVYLRALERAAADADGALLDTFLSTRDLDAIASQIATIGRDRHYEGAVAAAAHDLRGGLFSALLLELGAPRSERLSAHALQSLARDCSKQMRNLLADIDPPRRRQDIELRYHSLSELVTALRNYGGSERGGRVTLTIDADASASVAASCAEFGTIERVMFNLLENATTHTSTRAIAASLVAVADNLRVVVSNTLSSETADRVGQLIDHDRGVFYSSFSSTGSGLGLQVAAELVARAYGIETVAELVSGGYVGTAIVEGAFLSWFHWPLAQPSQDDGAVCGCDNA